MAVNNLLQSLLVSYLTALKVTQSMALLALQAM